MKNLVIPKETYHFPGITVIVPRQLDIVPVDKGHTPGSIQSMPPQFTLIRYVANIVFYHKTDIHGEPVTDFDPPVEFRVGYNFEDLLESKFNNKPLLLAYWDSRATPPQWIIVSDDAHEYQLLPSSTGQVAEFKTWYWPGDPAIAWGK
jgi:hypothetical protein